MYDCLFKVLGICDVGTFRIGDIFNRGSLNEFNLVFDKEAYRD